MKSLQDWVTLVGTLKTPVLASTVKELGRLRKNEDSVTGRDLSSILLHDPLMTLKVLRFSQSRLTRRQPTEVTTVEHALMMHGVTSFFREMRDLVALETQLAGHPDALDGALRVISRAVHAASFARSLSALRHDMDSDEVVTSALLHDLAELLLWVTEPSTALQIEHMVVNHRGLRSASAQHACLGFTLVDLQLPCAGVRLLRDREAGQPSSGRPAALDESSDATGRTVVEAYRHSAGCGLAADVPG
jgi:HD-like signal output (HDOD) protein